MCVFMKSGLGLCMGHLRSKTITGQIKGIPFVDDRGLSFDQFLMKLGQNVCLDEIWVGIAYGSSGVKN